MTQPTRQHHIELDRRSVVTKTRAAAEQAVITAARQIERAAQYGANVAGAVAEYEAARAEQARTRRQEEAA